MGMLSAQVEGYLERSSWIRKMFEAGAALKAQYGEDAVCDFSLGNPDLPPPAAVAEGLRELADRALEPMALGYMANAGHVWARQALAGKIGREQDSEMGPGDLLLTCGAAGGINVFFRAVLEPGDEVLCPAPYFVEYGFYAENHRGVLRPVRSRPGDFALDLEAMAAAVTPKTRVVLVNSPNNPTGRIYDRQELEALAALLADRSRALGRPIYLVSDEPYRQLAYDGAAVPPILPLYPYSVVVSSFSKSLSLPGERIGFVALNPAMPGKAALMNGLVLANRILGFVNAPVVGQAIMRRALDSQVDVSVYARRRDCMARVLKEAGYRFFMPQGAFYFFPEAPGGDDVAFVARLQEQRVLGVPGSGFGYPGYFRLAFCVDERIIERSAEGFRKAMAS